MKFEADPFYLYPIKTDLLDKLFIDRENEINIAKSIIEYEFEAHKEICVINGGTGVGKSSLLQYINKLSMDAGKKTCMCKDFQEFKSESIEEEILIIDNIDKLEDDKATTFYNKLEMLFETSGIIFFSDTYNRSRDVVNSRNFIVSDIISLPKRLDRDKLRFFLKERMKNCVEDKKDFSFPFTDMALTMSSKRANGNLRRFLRYTKSGWTIYRSKEKTELDESIMKESIINVDRSLLGGLDGTDLKILWYSTIGEPNKEYLAHECNIHRNTLNQRLNHNLNNLTSERREGKKVIINSIYKEVDGGQEIFEEILKGMGYFSDIVK